MNWIKTNWLIVVLSVVALSALPTMFVMSSNMNKAQKAKVAKETTAAYRDVMASKVTYGIPLVKQPDLNAFEKSADVNKVLTTRFAAARESIKEESSLLGVEAVKFNQGSRKLLIEDLFPKPSTDSRFKTPNQFTKMFVEESPRELLAKTGAKPPVDAKVLGASLADTKKQRRSRLQAQTGSGTLSPEDDAKLNQELFDQRLGRYRQHASETAFYATTDVFVDIPPVAPNPAPSLARLWDWQMKYWTYSDVLDAFVEANRMASGGGEPSVLTGVVKRIVDLRVLNPGWSDIPDTTPADATVEGAMVPPKNPMTPNMAVSVTGRESKIGSGNQYYDLRTAVATLVVASDKLPLLFDALAKTNFMTVLDCEIERIEPEVDLKDGYYYGDDHVVRATLTIECLWLRAWTKPFIPKTVRMQLNIPDDAPVDAAGGLPPQ